MQKERNIVEGKYPKNCWNKIILMLGINLLFVMCVHKTSERYEDMFVDSTWQSPFVAMNIEYKDSVYSIVPREGDMYLFLNDGVANKKYRYELFPILLEQTLGIDSITFCSLKEMDCMVTPQPYIIRKSKFPWFPERSVQFSGKRTKRSVQKKGCTQHL